MAKKSTSIKFSRIEITHLLIAWVIISLAFAILYSNTEFFSKSFLNLLIISAVTVGLGFLLHELAHKYVAQKYGKWAEFRADFFMLTLAFVMSFFGFILAAPGAVFISGGVTKEQNGKISIVGPLTNIVLALIFLALFFAVPKYTMVFAFGLLINSWLAVFNLIPVWNFDGKKVFDWNKGYYALAVVISISLMVASFMLGGMA